MFSLVCALSSPASAENGSSLFGWFTGITAQSDSSRTCLSAVRLCAFADQPRSWSDRDVPEVSRFSCLLLLSVRRFSDYAGSPGHSRLTQPAVLPSPQRGQGRHPEGNFRSSIAPPTDALVYASRLASRRHRQDSGS